MGFAIVDEATDSPNAPERGERRRGKNWGLGNIGVPVARMGLGTLDLVVHLPLVVAVSVQALPGCNGSTYSVVCALLLLETY